MLGHETKKKVLCVAFLQCLIVHDGSCKSATCHSPTEVSTLGLLIVAFLLLGFSHALNYYILLLYTSEPVNRYVSKCSSCDLLGGVCCRYLRDRPPSGGERSAARSNVALHHSDIPERDGAREREREKERERVVRDTLGGHCNLFSPQSVPWV